MLKLEDVFLARRKFTRRILNNQIFLKAKGQRIQSAQDYHRSTPDFCINTMRLSDPQPKSKRQVYLLHLLIGGHERTCERN